MSEEKNQVYQTASKQIELLCDGELDEIALMSSVAAVLHAAMPGFFWTGFYRRVGEGLVIGPYQGPVGCLRIAMGRGVCGTAALTGETQVVPDVHDFPGHIACDARSRSEIVVPVRNEQGDLIAVLDVDSTEAGHFDDIDREELEKIVAKVFQRGGAGA